LANDLRLGVTGSISVAHQLIAADLIDEYRLLVDCAREPRWERVRGPSEGVAVGYSHRMAASPDSSPRARLVVGNAKTFGGPAFLQQRLALFGKVVFLLSFGFFVIMNSMIAIGGRVPVAVLFTQQSNVFHLLSSSVMAALWLVMSVRRDRHRLDPRAGRGVVEPPRTARVGDSADRRRPAVAGGASGHLQRGAAESATARERQARPRRLRVGLVPDAPRREPGTA
jgi:hypothetical protein